MVTMVDAPSSAMDLHERIELIEKIRRELVAVHASHEAVWIVDWVKEQPGGTSAARMKATEQVIARRLQHEPLAYILGDWSFRSHDFFVGHGALIPRPETEEMVEAAIQSVENSPLSLARLLETGIRVADLGAGTGCVGLSFLIDLLQDLEDYRHKYQVDPAEMGARSKIVFVERSAEARVWLQKNIEAFRPRLRGAQVEVYAGSWNDWAQTTSHSIDILLSNPPYVTRQEYDQSVDISVKTFEPKEALLHDSEAAGDGHGAYREIIEISQRVLVPEGWVWLELGVAQGEWVQEYAFAQGAFNNLQTIKDIAKKPRFFCARKS